MNVDNLPDHMRLVLNKGLLAVNNYLKLLEAIKAMYSKENMKEKFRNVERHMNDCVKSITKAEEKVSKVLLQLGLKSDK